VKRKKVQPVGEKECEQVKKEVIAYLDEFIKCVGDQSEAIAYVKQNTNQKE